MSLSLLAVGITTASFVMINQLKKGEMAIFRVWLSSEKGIMQKEAL